MKALFRGQATYLSFSCISRMLSSQPSCAHGCPPPAGTCCWLLGRWPLETCLRAEEHNGRGTVVRQVLGNGRVSFRGKVQPWDMPACRTKVRTLLWSKSSIKQHYTAVFQAAGLLRHVPACRTMIGTLLWSKRNIKQHYTTVFQTAGLLIHMPACRTMVGTLLWSKSNIKQHYTTVFQAAGLLRHMPACGTMVGEMVCSTRARTEIFPVQRLRANGGAGGQHRPTRCRLEANM
eukprot:1152346-Pelagomonas_calceolata.AAC.8